MTNAELRDQTLQRMISFVTDVSRMFDQLPNRPAKKNFRNQLLRSASSIGANFAESNAAESRNDFIHKLSIALKEAEESCFWLRCIEGEFPSETEVTRIYDECKEFVKILQSCITKSKQTLGQ